MEGDGRGEQSAHLVAIDRVAPAGVTRVAIARSVFFCAVRQVDFSLSAVGACCMVHMPRRKGDTRDTYWTLVGSKGTTPYWWRGVLFPAATVLRPHLHYPLAPRPSPPRLKS